MTLEAIRNVVVHQTTEPDLIIVEQEVTGTVSTTGRRIGAFGVPVMRIDDGLLVHVRDYLDALTINHARMRPSHRRGSDIKHDRVTATEQPSGKER